MVILQIDSDQLSNLIETAVKKAIGEASIQKTDPEPDKLLTVEEAAEYLSLKVPTIYTLISRKELPTVKRSKRCYFFKSELNNYLRAGRKKIVVQKSEGVKLGP